MTLLSYGRNKVVFFLPRSFSSISHEDEFLSYDSNSIFLKMKRARSREILNSTMNDKKF